MAYFANGTAAEVFAASWCEHCVHSQTEYDEYGCAVKWAHYLYSYDLCNDEGPGKAILDMLITDDVEDGFAKYECKMFHPRSPEAALEKQGQMNLLGGAS